MELFDTHFVWFGQVLAVSGLKMLVLSNRYMQVVKSVQPILREVNHMGTGKAME